MLFRSRIYGNISYNDGIRPYKRPKDNVWYTPNIHISGPVEDCEVYNNVIYICKRAEGLPDQDKRFVHSNSWGGNPQSVTLKSNIFYSEVRESNFAKGASDKLTYTGNWYMGIGPASMGSALDTDMHGDHEGFKEILSKDADARKAIEAGLLREVKTKTATMITVDKDKLDKFFNNN